MARLVSDNKYAEDYNERQQIGGHNGEHKHHDNFLYSVSLQYYG